MNGIALLRVLLLEDNPLDAELIVDWLNSDGFDCQVHRMQTREEYSAALRDKNLDLILADYSLPGFDGISALELAKEMRPNVPFIFVSGHLGEELAIDTLKRGATDYVLKGRLERLIPAVKRALREAKERDERHRIETTLHIFSEASLVLSSLDYATTLSHVARLAVPHFADYCVVDVVGDNGIVERVAVAHADTEQELFARQLMQYTPARGSNHPIWQVLETGRSQLLAPMPTPLLEDITRDNGHLAIAQQMGICSVMFVPLMAPGRTLGVMTLISSSPDHSYTSLDVSLAEELARRCAMAVENARLHRQALDALRARDEFLAVLSHELRSPLTAILGWIHLLKNEETCDEETRLRGLEVIERNTNTQAQLIEDLLDVSRIITGRLKLEMLPVSLSHIVQNTLNSLAPLWQAKDIEVSFSCRADSDYVLGDAARLQQIIWNLVTNAIKFTPPNGHIELTIEAEEGRLHLTVKDSGEGIPAEFVPYVFDRFRQADSSSTRRHGGLGLGLSIVRHLTEMHGGTALVSSPGRGLGASFTIRLPQMPHSVAKAPTAVPEHANGSQDANRVLLNGLNILLVEDGDDARELIATILRGAGAQVTAAATAGEAMSALMRHTPDVLVSDIAMPGEDGYSLIRRVRDWEAEHHLQIPAIALTAYAGEHDRLQALSAGFTTHLAKPAEPSKLVAAISEVTRVSNAGSPLEAAGSTSLL